MIISLTMLFFTGQGRNLLTLENLFSIGVYGELSGVILQLRGQQPVRSAAHACLQDQLITYN